MGQTLLGRGGFYGWVTLAAASLVFLLHVGPLASFGVFLPAMSAELGWSRGSVSGAVMLASAVAGLSSPLVGWFVGNYGAKRAIVLGALLMSLGFALISFQSHLWQFYVTYGLIVGLGVSFGGFIPTTTLVNNWFDRRRSLALGILIAAGGLGGFVLIPGIMASIGAIGWRSTYLVMAAVWLVFMAVIPAVFVRNRPEELNQVPDGVASAEPGTLARVAPGQAVRGPSVDFTAAEAIRTRTFWLLIGFGLPQFFAVTVITTHQLAFLNDTGIVTGVAAATIFAIIPGAMTIGKLGAGWLGMWLSARTVALGSTVVSTAALSAMVMSSTLPGIIAATVLLGLGAGATMVAMVDLYPTYFGRTHYPKIMGITWPFLKIIGGAGAPFAGYFYDATGSYMGSFEIVILLLVAGLVCLALAAPPQHPSAELKLKQEACPCTIVL